jgi:hypothetical protein
VIIVFLNIDKTRQDYNIDKKKKNCKNMTLHRAFWNKPSIAREPPQQFFHPSSFAMHNHLSGKTDSHGDYTGIVNHLENR